MIICCCNKAYQECDKECPKGRSIKPKKIYQIPKWERRKLRYA